MKNWLNLFKYWTPNHLQIKILFFILMGLLVMQSCKKITEKKIIRKNHSTEIKNKIKKSDFFLNRAKNDSAYFYLNQAVLLCEPKKDYAEDYVYALTCIANIQKNNSDYFASEETLTKTLPYLKNIKNPEYAYNVYTLIAYNYYYSFDYNGAILYHLKALKLAHTSYKKSVILNDIILIYLSQEKYNEAAEILVPLTARKIKHENDPRKTDNNYSLLLDNLGYCYYKLGNPKAVECLNKSLKIKLEQNDQYGLIGTYNTLSLLYSKTDQKLSKMYARKAYKSASITNAVIYKLVGLATLIEKSEGAELKKYSVDFIRIADSFTSARQKAKNEFSRIRYESETDKAENLQLKVQKIENELQLEKQKNRNSISYIIIFFSTAISLFLYFYLTLKSKKEKNKAIFESEIRISKKLSDELSNDVYHALAFTQNTDFGKEENKEELLNNLDTIYSRTRNISKENSAISTDINYADNLKEMISGFKTPELNIILNGFDSVFWHEIAKNKKIVLFRVLQELFSNMKKHSNASVVGITFKISNQNLFINYADNGNGVDLNIKVLRNGLKNVEKRIEHIKGQIDIDSTKGSGFKVFIQFPI
ncbi:ATP-binding protein [Flavobacterium sp. FlaQc-47]|uniref:tetratricopeptide repeat-containing sensor histidine kinase n=1 Tax=Flavobacterium sp. FlaQc-47 TaxID=3374180 RepID=UPI003757A53A